MHLPRTVQFFCLFGTVSLIAAGSCRALEITKLREVSFDGIVQRAVFDTGDRVKLEKGRVRFYAPGGKVKRTLKLRGKETLVCPPGSDVVGIAVYADRQPMTFKIVRFELFNIRGRSVLRLNKPKFATVLVSPRGNAICGIDGAAGLPESNLLFYNDRGKLVRSVAVKRFAGGGFSRDGSRFLFETAEQGLHVAGADGEIFYKLNPAPVWGASANGRIIVVAVGDQLQCFRDRELIGSLRLPMDGAPVRDIAVAPDGRHAAVVSSRHAVALRVDPPTLLWEHTGRDADWNFRSVDLIDSGHLVAIGADHDPGADGKRHTRSRCLILNTGGDPVKVLERSPKQWSAYYPQVRFDRSGKRLIIEDRDAVVWYSVSK